MAKVSSFSPVFGAVVAAVLIAYYLHIPLPQRLTDRSKMQVVEFFMRMAYFYPMKSLALLGGGWQLYWTRLTLGAFARLVGPWTLHDEYVRVRDGELDGVPVRFYEPAHSRASDGAIFFIHGGGFVVGDVASYEGLVREIARHSRMVTVSVEYRLAPEHLFPAGIEDCERAIGHLMQNASAELDVDPRKIVIMGDSAGGNLAAVVAQRLRQRRDLPPVKLQVLIYPLMQYLDFRTPSYQLYYREYADTAFLDPESIARWLLMYLGVQADQAHVDKVLSNNHTPAHTHDWGHLDFVRHDRLPQHFRLPAVYEQPDSRPHGDNEVYDLLEPFLFNPDFSPLMQPDLSGLPRTFLMTCQFDILRDEGVFYATRLAEHGVPVTWRHYDEGFHAMLNFYSELQLARAAIQDIAHFIHQHIGGASHLS